jgi:predicted kinase
MPKLIFMNGPAAVGKSTIAELYAQEHSLALHLKFDELIVMLGQWLAHEDEARELVFSMIQDMVKVHLSSGHDVVMPYLPRSADQIDQMRRVADEAGATFYEISLMTDKQEAVERMMRRGSWGEPGADPLTEEDRPIVSWLYDLAEEYSKRPQMFVIRMTEGDIDGTYQQLIKHISKV